MTDTTDTTTDGATVSISDLEARLGRSLQPYYPQAFNGHPAMDLRQVAEGLAREVEAGSSAAIRDACLFIREDPKLAFGLVIKSRLAIALRQHAERLNELDRRHVAERLTEILSRSYVPSEAEDYSRLIGQLGGHDLAYVLEHAQPQAEKARKLLVRLRTDAARHA